jgi:NitT/TauT family transport system ATP-binding protein
MLGSLPEYCQYQVRRVPELQGMHNNAPDGVVNTVPAHQARPEKIAIRGLSKRFRSQAIDVMALDRFDLTVAEGEFICIVGPSGCGKTTLLRILAGLERPTAGTVDIIRRDPARPLTSMIFQETSIFPWLSVRDNVGYGLDMRRVARGQRQRSVGHFLELTGLARFADAFPHQLSGGMKQRVSVARAFANDPEILLMDEPFAALDEQTKIILQQELLKLWSESRKTVIFITHSIDEALVLADRIIVVSGRPGALKADIPVGFERPRQVQDLKSSREFGHLWREIWSLLGVAAAPT